MDESSLPRTIPVNGIELTYVEQGDGDPLLFVHGTLGDYREWLDQFAPFAEQYRTIAYSRRAHYPNAWPTDYTICDPEVHAADLAALIAALNLGSVHLFGHSYGALISLVLASRQPDLVRTLTLGEPPLMPLLEATPEGRGLVADFGTRAWEPAQRAFQQGEMEAGVRVFLDGVIGQGAFNQLPPPVRSAMLDNANEMAVETRTPPGMFFSTLTRADVERLPMPVLLLGGELSPPLFTRILDELAAALPGAERATIPGVSHDLYNPPAFAETVLGFLAQHPRRGPHGRSS